MYPKNLLQHGATLRASKLAALGKRRKEEEEAVAQEQTTFQDDFNFLFLFQAVFVLSRVAGWVSVWVDELEVMISRHVKKTIFSWIHMTKVGLLASRTLVCLLKKKLILAFSFFYFLGMLINAFATLKPGADAFLDTHYGLFF